ncbi:MAG TPA: glycosyltransferase family 9 protein [Candidatus Hydrogenedentes bacterium]|nr:glycosyltransferase family 9 protein [Candidatus Hydrogenedentota bacterium]
MRTLVVHTGGIGDFLLSCPALACLVAEGPVELAGSADRITLAVAGGLAARAHSLDAIDFASVFTAPSARLRAFLAGFDRAVVWMRDDDAAIASGLGSCGVADVRCFAGLPPADWPRHASEYYLAALGYPAAPPFRLAVAPTPRHEVILAPGSGGRRKNWPFDRFLTVAGELAARGYGVAWCVGPAEESLRLPENHAALRDAPLVEIAGILAGARLYIGNDSGITHLAAAVGCPTVAVFGPTDPTVWAPRGARVHVVAGDPWPDAEAVLRDARAVLA